MNVIFLGSSKYSTIDEKTLNETLGLSCVVTLPDRLDSKTKQPVPNPVKKYALDNAIPVITTEKITPEIIEEIKKHDPDFLVVADFGLILRKALLDLPKKAAINVHHSLLPKYRGPAPVPFAILAGETIVGVTVMLMAQKIDAGDILAQATYDLLPDDTSDSVLTKLNELGGDLAVKVIQNFDEYYAKKTPQDESLATFTHFMSRNDGYIDIDNVPSLKTENWKLKINQMIRAYYPWPGVWFKTRIKNQEVRIKLLPGNVLQVEGKKPMSYKDFMNGYSEGKEILEKLKLV